MANFNRASKKPEQDYDYYYPDGFIFNKIPSTFSQVPNEIVPFATKHRALSLSQSDSLFLCPVVALWIAALNLL